MTKVADLQVESGGKLKETKMTLKQRLRAIKILFNLFIRVVFLGKSMYQQSGIEFNIGRLKSGNTGMSASMTIQEGDKPAERWMVCFDGICAFGFINDECVNNNGKPFDFEASGLMINRIEDNVL